VVEAGEECELGARSTGGDGLAPGTVYDEWSCDESCNRRYVYTSCSSNLDCGGGGSMCFDSQCTPPCDSGAPFMPNNTDPRRYVLSEIRAMREQIAALTSELRSRKQRAAKRVRSRRQRLDRDPDPLYRPTELDIARARRALR
jgi:hypothetical protein